MNNTKAGNSVGNISNGGYAAHEGDWVYYVEDDDIFKVKRDGTNLTNITEFEIGICSDADYLNVVGDWIYYRASNRYYVDDKLHTEEIWNIYRIRNDGTQKTKICNDRVKHLAVVGDWIYYCDITEPYTSYICRIRTNGTERTKICDDKVRYLAVLGDWIYYSNEEDEGRIYRIRTDGTQRTKIGDAKYPEHLIVQDNWLYFTGWYENDQDDRDYKNGVIVKMHTDGREVTKVNNNESSHLNVKGDWIYYINKEDGNRIYKIRTNGTELTKVCDYSPEEVYGLCIVDQWILICNDDFLDKLYKLHLDGRKRVLSYYEVGDYITNHIAKSEGLNISDLRSRWIIVPVDTIVPESSP